MDAARAAPACACAPMARHTPPGDKTATRAEAAHVLQHGRWAVHSAPNANVGEWPSPRLLTESLREAIAPSGELRECSAAGPKDCYEYCNSSHCTIRRGYQFNRCT